MAEGGGNNLVIRYRRCEKADILGKTVHFADNLFRNCWIIVRQVALDQLCDELRFSRRKAAPRCLCGTGRIGLKRFLRFPNGSYCCCYAVGFLSNLSFRCDQCGESIVPGCRWPAASTDVENDGPDSASYGNFRAHTVSPKTVQLALFKCLCSGKTERDACARCARDRTDLHMVAPWIYACID